MYLSINIGANIPQKQQTNNSYCMNYDFFDFVRAMIIEVKPNQTFLFLSMEKSEKFLFFHR
jgi:hypothetical protein